MGLDSFTSDDNEPEDNEPEEQSDDSQEQPTDDDFPNKRQMGIVTKSRARKHDLDIDIDGEQLTGHAEDFGMLFALMCLDVPDADLDNIEHDS